jgi:hypothetical protein
VGLDGNGVTVVGFELVSEVGAIGKWGEVESVWECRWKRE